MWTKKNRARYDRSKLRYPSDLTDEEWQLVEPLIPPRRPGGDKRTVIMREVVNGLMYVLSTGCQWRAIPKDLPPKSTVCGAGTAHWIASTMRSIKPKTFKTERRQFAEAVLSRAVLVVEGSTEAALFATASTVLEQIRGPDKYTHFDLAGVTVFDAGGDGAVPRYGPVFKALGKVTF